MHLPALAASDFVLDKWEGDRMLWSERRGKSGTHSPIQAAGRMPLRTTRTPSPMPKVAPSVPLSDR